MLRNQDRRLEIPKSMGSKCRPTVPAARGDGHSESHPDQKCKCNALSQASAARSKVRLRSVPLLRRGSLTGKATARGHEPEGKMRSTRTRSASATRGPRLSPGAERYKGALKLCTVMPYSDSRRQAFMFEVQKTIVACSCTEATA